MKKFSPLYFGLLMICAVFFVSLNSCSKDEDVPAAVPPTETIGLTADKNQYAPYEIVTFSSEDAFASGAFAAKIDGIDVSVATDENTASFVLPNLGNGTYDLTFVLDGKNYNLPVTVATLSGVLAANQYFNQMTAGINASISALNDQIDSLEASGANPDEYASLESDAIKFTDLLNSYTTAYNNLSDTEKQEFAKAIAANKAVIDEYNSITGALNSSTSALRSPQSVQDYETGVEICKASFTSSVVFTVAHIPFILAGAKLAALPNPLTSAGAVLATGLLVTSFMLNLETTVTAGMNLTNKSLKPFEFIAQSSQEIYDSGVETVSNIQAKYRSIINSDAAGNTINAIVGKFNFLRNKYNAFVNGLPSIFRPSYVMASLKNTYNSTTRSIYNQYVSISNVSNPNVTVQQLNQPDGSIKIKATTAATTDQNFTYDVTYTNGNFTTGLTKTVNAKVLSSACSENLILGVWHVQDYYVNNNHPDGFTPNESYYWIMTLYADGQMTMQASSETTVHNMTYGFGNCHFGYNFFGCGHGFNFVEGVSTYTVSGCGGFHHHTYTKQ